MYVEIYVLVWFDFVMWKELLINAEAADGIQNLGLYLMLVYSAMALVLIPLSGLTFFLLLLFEVWLLFLKRVLSHKKS